MPWRRRARRSPHPGRGRARRSVLVAALAAGVAAGTLAAGAVAARRSPAAPGPEPAAARTPAPSAPDPAAAPSAPPAPAAPGRGAPGRAASPPPVPADSGRAAVSPPSPPPVPAGYVAPPGEVRGAAKAVAAAAVEQLLNYDPGTTLGDLAARVAGDDPGRRAGLAAAARPLHHPGRASRGTVVYPQLGGMRPDRASVMVVARQEVWAGDRRERAETRTLDVRLLRRDGAWAFDELASAGGERVRRPADLSAEAAAVVDHPAIELPDSARWDVYRGAVAPALLRLMAELADRAPYAVAVLEGGHPFHVFGTSRVSAHSRGRAVDVYRVGDVPVVDARVPGSAVQGLVSWLYARPEVAQVGSPWALDGRGGRSFTDEVHQDHVHIAVRP